MKKSISSKSRKPAKTVTKTAPRVSLDRPIPFAVAAAEPAKVPSSPKPSAHRLTPREQIDLATLVALQVADRAAVSESRNYADGTITLWISHGPAVTVPEVAWSDEYNAAAFRRAEALSLRDGDIGEDAARTMLAEAIGTVIPASVIVDMFRDEAAATKDRFRSWKVGMTGDVDEGTDRSSYVVQQDDRYYGIEDMSDGSVRIRQIGVLVDGRALTACTRVGREGALEPALRKGAA